MATTTSATNLSCLSQQSRVFSNLTANLVLRVTEGISLMLPKQFNKPDLHKALSTWTYLGLDMHWEKYILSFFLLLFVFLNNGVMRHNDQEARAKCHSISVFRAYDGHMRSYMVGIVTKMSFSNCGTACSDQRKMQKYYASLIQWLLLWLDYSFTTVHYCFL